MQYDLGKMRRMAQGGQADIYEIDERRILRVLREADVKDTEMLMQERSVMDQLCGRGVSVPEVYDYVEVGGKPALVMERIAGPSMLDRLSARPLAMGATARELSRLHAEFLSCPAVEGLMEIKDRVDWLVDRSALLDGDDRAFVRSLLAELPAGNALLHGDFHPGNILTQGGKSYIIDWFGASKGAALSDVAHTYLLCADKPRVPGENPVAFRLTKAFARRFGGLYLKDIRARLGFEMGEFGKWLAVRAAERSAYGQKSELQGRVAFVRACRRLREEGVDPSLWYRSL